MQPDLDPEGFERRISQYAEWLRVNHYSERSVEGFTKSMRYLVAWAADRAITRPSEVTKLVLERYQAHLYHYRKSDGNPLTLTSQRNRIAAFKNFFRWMARQNLMLYNPASEIQMPRLGRRLPKHVLSVAEVGRILAVPDVRTAVGIRDRALLETLYSTGLRRMELVDVKLLDLDRDRGTLFVRNGKGRKQRMIPIGDRALRWIEKYLADVRPEFVVPPDEGYVFLTHRGKPFEIGSLTELVRVHVERADLGKGGAVHLLRHAMATHMLENGADVRFVQAMLGHEKLETTAIYTHVAIKKLQEIHEATHPAERKTERQMKKRPGSQSLPGRSVAKD